MADLDAKLKPLNSHPWDVPKIELWHQQLLELIPILLKLLPGRKRAVFAMSRNPLHLGVEILTKTRLHRNSGKAKTSNIRLHTRNGMVPQTVNKITQGESTAILDGAEHRMILSASRELADIHPCHIMHNERIFPSPQRRALDIHDHSIKTKRVILRPSHGRPRYLDQNLISFHKFLQFTKTHLKHSPTAFYLPFNRQRICTYRQLC